MPQQEGSSKGNGNGNDQLPTNQAGGGGSPPQNGPANVGAEITSFARPARSGMSNETKLILGMVIAAIVATGIVIAVVVGTVLGTQILHNGTQIRNLATRIADEQDDRYASVHTQIQVLRSELAAGVSPDLVDKVRRDHRRLHDRLHNIERELSDVYRSVRGLRSGTATTQRLNHQLQNIGTKLEQLNQSLQRIAGRAATDVDSNLETPRSGESPP